MSHEHRLLSGYSSDPAGYSRVAGSTLIGTDSPQVDMVSVWDRKAQIRQIPIISIPMKDNT